MKSWLGNNKSKVKGDGKKERQLNVKLKVGQREGIKVRER